MNLRKLLMVLLSAALLLGTAVAPGYSKKPTAPRWGGTDSPLRPGSSLGGYCTFNFVFYRPGTPKAAPKAYIGTAGHCTDELGERVEQPDLGEIGEVVYDSDLVESTVDFSLIEIDADKVAQTNPEVMSWGGPTRSITQEDLVQGDQVDVYGYGLGVGENEQTRPRYGFLIDWDDEEYKADMPAVNGDSGAPLIHDATGAALGIISRYGIEPPLITTDQGPLMPWIFEELTKAGFGNVRLATVSK
jgi:hypothetical protein